MSRALLQSTRAVTCITTARVGSQQHALTEKHPRQGGATVDQENRHNSFGHAYPPEARRSKVVATRVTRAWTADCVFHSTHIVVEKKRYSPARGKIYVRKRMSKPILEVDLITPEDRQVRAKAVLDSGSFYTFVRKDVLPKGTKLVTYKKPQLFQTAGKTGSLSITGTTRLVVVIGNKMINVAAFVSPDLRSEMLIGAEAMQSWNITIRNRNGKTTIEVGHDMRDPEISEID